MAFVELSRELLTSASRPDASVTGSTMLVIICPSGAVCVAESAGRDGRVSNDCSASAKSRGSSTVIWSAVAAAIAKSRSL
jgi:hypothetical protein